MSKRPFVVFGIFALICVVAVPWIALGKNGDQDAATVKVASRDQSSKDLFATNCGPCHTLAAAGTDGVVGPNLDQLLVPGGTNSAESFPATAGRVMQAVTCGVEGRMPKGILEEEEAKRVATFVGAYAGQIGKGPVVDTDDVKSPEPPSSCG
jgi:mono/diheme cytochrome c family protein